MPRTTVAGQIAPPRRRSGGRSARVVGAVLAAALGEIVDTGYAHMTIDTVASRAGVHRTTVYRRWPTKEALVVDALLAHTEQAVRVPDTGSLSGDLRGVMLAVIANLTSEQGGALTRTIVAEAARTPAIRELARTFWQQRFSSMDEVLERAIGRGELPPEVDRPRLIESLIGPLYFRLLVSMDPPGEADVDRLLDVVLCRGGRV